MSDQENEPKKSRKTWHSNRNDLTGSCRREACIGYRRRHLCISCSHDLVAPSHGPPRHSRLGSYLQSGGVREARWRNRGKGMPYKQSCHRIDCVLQRSVQSLLPYLFGGLNCCLDFTYVQGAQPYPAGTPGSDSHPGHRVRIACAAAVVLRVGLCACPQPWLNIDTLC